MTLQKRDSVVSYVDPESGEADTFIVRNRFTYNPRVVSKATAVDMRDAVSRTKQSFAEDADINTIVKRFNLTGQLPDDARAPVYQDFEGVFDFQSAMNAVINAEQAFMAFPAEVRREFDNDPQKMLEFVANKENRARAIELGLVPKPAEPPAEPPPMKVHVVSQDPAPKAP